MTIDEEIKELKGKIEISVRLNNKDGEFDADLVSIQTIVLTSHATLEKYLNDFILTYYKILLLYPSNILANIKWGAFEEHLQMLLDITSYRNKVDLLSSYREMKPHMLQSFRKANTYRVEFAHSNGKNLIEKYDTVSPKGKQNIRDLLRCFDHALQEANGLSNELSSDLEAAYVEDEKIQNKKKNLQEVLNVKKFMAKSLKDDDLSKNFFQKVDRLINRLNFEIKQQEIIEKTK